MPDYNTGEPFKLSSGENSIVDQPEINIISNNSNNQLFIPPGDNYDSKHE